MPIRRPRSPLRPVQVSVAALAAAVLASLLVAVGVPAAGAAEQVANVSRPAVVGKPRYAERLTADPGTWSPADVSVSYRWLRDGTAIAGATGGGYRVTKADIGTRLAVRVVATSPGLADGHATSTWTRRVSKAVLTSVERPRVLGVRRFTRVLTAETGEWSRRVRRFTYQWLRGDTPIRGARGKRYRLDAADVGHRIAVRVRAHKDGYRIAGVRTPRTAPIGHRVPVRARVTYTVRSRGEIVVGMSRFRRESQGIFDDPRGWRNAGIAFRRVPRGGDFTLVLSAAGSVPSFSSGCSARWSCRVGRYVIINQDRWRFASASWRNAGQSIRAYRHLVVNHETGHWLGHGHRGCPGQGALAPVMMQQSISLGGCRHNPFPRPGELRTPRLG